MADQHGPGHKIEEELASALGEGVIDTVEPTDNTINEPLQHDAHDATGVAPTQDGDAEINPDVATIISEIMDHTERQEQTVALGPQELPPSNDFPGARGFAFLKANSHLKIQSLPILDNLVSATFLTNHLPTLKLTPSISVYADFVLPVKEYLPRPHCHGFRA
jgi:hypothetical protein